MQKGTAGVLAAIALCGAVASAAAGCGTAASSPPPTSSGPARTESGGTYPSPNASSSPVALSPDPASSPPASPPGATAAPGTQPLLYAITETADRVYFSDLQAGFVAAAGQLGARAATADAQVDPMLALNLVREAIAAGATGIALTAPDQSMGPQAAAAAQAAGVSLLATDVPLIDVGGAAVPLVAYDDAGVGMAAGGAAARLLGEYRWNPAKVGVLSAEVQTNVACSARTAAAREALRSAGVRPGQVFAVVYGGEEASAEMAAAPVIAGHPDVVRWLVIGCNDEGVSGILAALGTFHVTTDDVLAVGIGGYLACVPWAANQASGFRAAVLLSGRAVGAGAARALYERVVDGTALPAVVPVRPEVVGPSDLAAVQQSYPCR